LKKLVYTIVVSVFFFGCSKKEYLSANLEKVLIDYQKKFPVTSNKAIAKNSIYIYTANFSKDKKDSLLILSRTSNGVADYFKSYGIYQNEELQPTLVYDVDNIGSKFILKKISKLDKKYYSKETVFREGFPPLYTYLVKNKELKLIAIDTVWESWD
jgi:hypothetical protein